MIAQSILSIALLACGSLAAPTPDVSSIINDLGLDKRADWQTGKCEATISVNIPAAPFRNPDLYWTVNIIDNPGAQIGHWETKNALEKDRQISTSKGPLFYIRGQPQHSDDSPNALTLYYGSQQWNSQDCYRYTKFEKQNFYGNDYRHEYLCQFDC